MQTWDVLMEARALLDGLTPLNGDCGAVCGGACCRPLPGETTGMLLFPGEERCYEGVPGCAILPAVLGSLLVCDGHCDRALRPLSCRLFPLLPVLRPEGVRVAVDARARAVCPLARQGRWAMSADFVAAVRQCGELLAADPVQRAFLLRLTEEQDALREMQKRFAGGAAHA